MKSNNVFNTEVLVHGARDSGNFRIAANGKAFKILIDGLYSNKIQAIVRELSSNAFDAQIVAGRGDTPFDIRLPNLLDPTFSVRDYGTSLSHTDIMGLYTTVFASSKEGSNLEIGKFGLGSKTPFAYTDNFTVIAYLRGTKRVYGAYITVDGIPQISLMDSEDTDEPDGLMVSFPVNSKDCERFRLETERVYEGFDAKPNIYGGTVSEIVRTVLHRGSNFKIFAGNGGARAKQGCVIYPIDLDALPALTPGQEAILESSILIDFPIGQLDITPSRETLSYDDITIQNILDMAENINSEILAEHEATFSKIRTMYEARSFVAELQKSKLDTVLNWIATLKFNGKPVETLDSMARDKLNQVYGVAITHVDNDILRKDKTIKFFNKDYVTRWEVDGDTMFIVEDMTLPKRMTYNNARIRKNIAHHTNVLWIRNNGASPKQWRNFVKRLGFPPKFYRLEDLALPAREKRVYEAAPRISKNEIRAAVLSKSYTFYDERIIDLNTIDDTWTYLLFHKGYCHPDEDNEDTSISISHLSKFITDTENIIIVKKKDLPKIKRVGIKNILAVKRDELFKTLDFQKHNENENLDKEMNHWIKNYAESLSKFPYDRDTSFKKVLDFVAKYDKVVDRTNSTNIYNWRLVVPTAVYNDALNNAPADFDGDKNLKHWVQQMERDYPLVKIFTDSYYDHGKFRDNLPHIIKYIELIDKETYGL